MSPTCSDAPEAARGAPPSIPWRRAPFLLGLYAGAVAALSWPWLAAFGTRVANHWDPPFHAWKLMFAARTLLDGRILPPDGNTNLYYPYSGAFFYEALHWPQAVFAAPMLAAGVSPVATYHATLLFFWALSGVIFWAWLRALGLRPAGAVLGGLFFTVLPYRMSYLVEFNMQLVFGLALLLLAITRFFQRPGFRYALLAAVAWWLQATSELYQAFFVVLAFPLLILPLASRDASLLRSWRRLWLPLCAAVALCAALSLPFLLPYARTLGDGSLSRSLVEMRNHTLEPFSYLHPWGRLRLLPIPTAREDEMSVFPTAALLLAAILAFGRRAYAALRAPARRADRLFAAAVAILAALSLLTPFFNTGGRAYSAAISWTALAAVLLSIPALLVRRGNVPRAMAAGLGAAALFGVVMSFGPEIRISTFDETAPNVLFLCMRAIAPGLAGFRVMSRFSVFPVIAVCVAAAVSIDDASSALRSRPCILRAGIALFLCVFLAESFPPRLPATRLVRDVSRSAAISALDRRAEPYVLAIVPMGDRSLDSEHMLAIERHDRLGVWAWGGAYPRWTSDVVLALSYDTGNPADAAALLRQVWPEALVLEDRRQFRGGEVDDYASWFGPLAETIAEDADFRLMRLAPATDDDVEAIRLVRRDFAVARPFARFSLSAAGGPARVWLDINGKPVGAWDVAGAPVECAAPIHEWLLVDHLPERFRFHAEGDVPFRLGGFRLDAEDGGALHALLPDIAPDLPWLATSRMLPPGAVPLDVRYPGGVALRGALIRPCNGGGDYVPLRLFMRFPGKARVVPALTLAPGFASNGKVLFRYMAGLRGVVDANVFGMADGALLAVDIDMPVPDILRHGEDYDLTLDLVGATGRRRSGRDTAGRKVRHAPLGLVWTPGGATGSKSR